MDNIHNQHSSDGLAGMPAVRDERYELLLKAIETIEDHAIFTLDAEGNVQTWNHGARKIKGYFHDEIIGRNFSIFYPEEDRKRNRPFHELLIAKVTGRFEEEEWRVRKSGERFLANVVITSIKDASGNISGYTKVTRDLTEKKRDEEKIHQAEERARLLIDNISDYAIFMLDSEGKVITWNTGAERINGYRPQEIIGKHFSIFYSEEDIKAGKPDMELRVAASSEGRYEDIGRRLKKDGSSIWANVIITAIKNAQGELIGFSKITRDLTERKKIEDLEDALKMRDEFLSVVSHELRTPLTKILLNVQMMKRNSSDHSERTLKSLDSTESNTKELIEIMDSLVEVNRLRSGKMEVKRTKTNITDHVIKVIGEYKDDIRLSGSQVSFSHPGDVIGYWDQRRIDQLVSALLSNAVNYGKGQPIRIELSKVEDGISLVIADQGEGIPYQKQLKVFERFERAANYQQTCGLGLGLYLAKQIVDAHKGTISLESQPGNGSTFTVFLPLTLISVKNRRA